MQGLARISGRCGYCAGGDEADESRSYVWLSQSHVDTRPPTHTGFGVAAGRLAAVVDFSTPHLSSVDLAFGPHSPVGTYLRLSSPKAGIKSKLLIWR